MSKILQESNLPLPNTVQKKDFLKTHAPSLDHRMIDSKGNATVTELFVEMRLEQSVASQHLAILRRAGIVKKEREGKYMYYKLNLERLQLLNKIISDLLK